MAPSGLELRNPNLDSLETDHLYHLGLSTNDNLEARFSDVRFICMGGTPQRMLAFAQYLKGVLGVNDELQDLAAVGHRYAMYKVGPVLSVSHGMGAPSFSILLHELFKLIKYAKCRDVTMIRIGTSGGIGVPGGTVVVSNGALDDLLNESHEFHVLGKAVIRPCVLDQQLADDLVALSQREFPGIPITQGKTMCSSDFYEAQGRLDGAICYHTAADKQAFLEKLQALGVKNIEMEASLFAAMCAQVGVRAAVVCVTLLNRLNTDQVTTEKKVQLEWQDRPQKVVGAYIRKTLLDS